MIGGEGADARHSLSSSCRPSPSERGHKRLLLRSPRQRCERASPRCEEVVAVRLLLTRGCPVSVGACGGSTSEACSCCVVLTTSRRELPQRCSAGAGGACSARTLRDRKVRIESFVSQSSSRGREREEQAVRPLPALHAYLSSLRSELLCAPQASSAPPSARWPWGKGFNPLIQSPRALGVSALMPLAICRRTSVVHGVVLERAVRCVRSSSMGKLRPSKEV